MAVYGPVHILPYDPKWHELFAILYFLSKIMQVPGRSIYYRSIYENRVSSTYANILIYHIQGMPTNIILQVFI